MGVDAELLHDGRADLVHPLCGCCDVRKDGVVADRLVLVDEKLFSFNPDPCYVSLPLVKLARAVIQISEND